MKFPNVNYVFSVIRDSKIDFLENRPQKVTKKHDFSWDFDQKWAFFEKITKKQNFKKSALTFFLENFLC